MGNIIPKLPDLKFDMRSNCCNSNSNSNSRPPQGRHRRKRKNNNRDIIHDRKRKEEEIQRGEDPRVVVLCERCELLFDPNEKFSPLNLKE